MLGHTQAPNGGFGWSAANSSVVHCLNGNTLRALVAFGWHDDARVRRAVEWQARSVTGEGFDGYFRSSTSGARFGLWDQRHAPVRMGAIEALRGLTAIPSRRRSPLVRRAIREGATFLLSVDPATAAYPAAYGVSRNRFKLGFPSGYVADLLQNLEVLADLGHAGDPRLANAIELVSASRMGTVAGGSRTGTGGSSGPMSIIRVRPANG